MTLADFLDAWRSEADYVEAHTSGSTGAPKPVRLLKSDMAMSARATIDFFGIAPGHLLALPLALDYIAGKMMAVRAELSGATLLVEEPSRTPLAAERRRVRLAAIVPQQIDGLLDAPCEIDHIIVGGAPTSPELEARALQCRPSSCWWATYGMTETCSHVALRPFGSDIYQALPGVTFGADSRGCLVISREGASWSPVVTNDIAELLSPSEFRFIGRADNVIISGGLKIHPEEVERMIAPAMGGRAFCVVGKPSERWGSEPELVVEGEPDADGGEALLVEVSVLAGSVRRPRSVRFVSRLPRTSSGKIRRSEVTQRR